MNFFDGSGAMRCKGGISHHPAESVKTSDVAKTLAVLREFILSLATSASHLR